MLKSYSFDCFDSYREVCFDSYLETELSRGRLLLVIGCANANGNLSGKTGKPQWLFAVITEGRNIVTIDL